MKDIKHTCIRCDFHPVAWVMPHGVGLRGDGESKIKFAGHMAYQIKGDD